MTDTHADAGTATTYRLPFTVVTGLFFLWGFITCMNEILISYLKVVFSLNHM